ncbi:hypothetical protein VCHE25_0231 [Vibrio cholerae HE-25]|nr:hypothetical protein VCHE25_0231 [Vibrio cholerae HE-25]
MLSENEKASGIPLAFLYLNNFFISKERFIPKKTPSGFPMNIDCLCA